MRVLMRKLKMEVCWTVLRYFNYDDELQIVKHVCWDDKSMDNSMLTMARSFELKKPAFDFLITMFKMHATKQQAGNAEKLE